MNIPELLKEITMISQKYQTLYQKSGGHFNVFNAAGIEHNEVMLCRVLRELLSPTGIHCQGSVYLRLFTEHVLHIKIQQAELDGAVVIAEYGIGGQRRIDLVIRTRTLFLPIEVKIYACDQEKQCFDYYQEASKHMNNPQIYYLTRFGTPPSPVSAAGLTPDGDTYKEVCLLSFKKDILHWLSLCLKEICTIKAAPIREVLLQLMQVIRQFTGDMEDEEKVEIRNLLLASPEALKSAVAISNTLHEAKEELMLRLLKAVEAKVAEKSGREKLDNPMDYAYDEFARVRSYYSYKYSTYPGISYLYKERSAAGTDRDIWVRMEIENRVFVGYCCPPPDGDWEKTIEDDAIRKVLGVEPRKSNWWAYAEDLPDDAVELSPDFKYENPAFYDLANQEKFRQFVEKCADRICEMLV